MLSTLLVSHLERSSIEARFEQPKNTPYISFTFEVSKLERPSMDSSALQLPNILFMVVTLEVSSFDTSTELKAVQFMNQYAVLTGAIP